MNKLILFALFISSCESNNAQKCNIDTTIKVYNNENFTFFTDRFICIKHINLTEVIYIVEKSDGNLPIYFVTFSLLSNKITEINNSALVESNIADYLTKDEITDFVLKFREFNFSLLQVDIEGNVFINPCNPNQPAILLRLKESISDNIVKKGYVYTRYKNKWYSRE
jgi:hypothetical protein